MNDDLIKGCERLIVFLCGAFVGGLCCLFSLLPSASTSAEIVQPAAVKPHEKQDRKKQDRDLTWCVEKIDRIERSLEVAHSRINALTTDKNNQAREIDRLWKK